MISRRFRALQTIQDQCSIISTEDGIGLKCNLSIEIDQRILPVEPCPAQSSAIGLEPPHELLYIGIEYHRVDESLV